MLTFTGREVPCDELLIDSDLSVLRHVGFLGAPHPLAWLF